MKKTITINFETWQKLLKLKAEKNFRSLDEVINYLIEKSKTEEK